MLKLLERKMASAADRLVVLAPPQAKLSSSFRNVVSDVDRHSDLLRELQAFRGRIYVNDGALKPEHLTPDGLHVTPEDEKSWHVLLLDDDRRVSGSIWYLEHDAAPALEQLRVYHSPLARQGASRDRLRAAVTSETDRATSEGVKYAEVGGWAIARGSKPADCLLAVLSTYSLSQILGGALVIAMATIRNSSAPILRRLGGSSLQVNGDEISPYYDPRYGCTMELLRFDTRTPDAKFTRFVETLRERLADTMIVSPAASEDAVMTPEWLQNMPVPVWQQPALAS